MSHQEAITVFKELLAEMSGIYESMKLVRSRLILIKDRLDELEKELSPEEQLEMFE